MYAMILSAGKGSRMRPLTDKLPKPMLEVAGRPLIEHHLERLAAAGVDGVVINLHHLGKKIQDAMGTARYGMRIRYSQEAILLGTGGGIVKALPLLEGDWFITVNADVWTDYDYSRLRRMPAERSDASAGDNGAGFLGHLILVADATHNPQGDFYLDSAGLVHKDPPEAGGEARRLTFSGISLLHRDLFSGLKIQARPLTPLLHEAMGQGRISGDFHAGRWLDVGTPQRLKQANDLGGTHP